MRPTVVLILALLAIGASGFAWDGGTPPPHRRSLALPGGTNPIASSRQNNKRLQRRLLQDGSSGSSSSSGQGDRPCTTPASRLHSNGTQPDVLAQICGDRSACSVLLVAIGVIVLLVIFACGLGGLCSRRRQRQQVDATEQHRAEPYGAHAIGLAEHQYHTGLADAECESVRAMPPEKQAELQVRPVRDGDEAWGSRQECSICLEAVAADSGAWMVFPCHHGACGACVADLVRYNRRPDRRVVHCPLCRSLALVPPSSVLPGTVATPSPAGAAAAAAAAAPGHSGQAVMGPMGDGSRRLFWLV